MPSFAPPAPTYPTYTRDLFALQFLQLADRWQDVQTKLYRIATRRGSLEDSERNLLLEAIDGTIQPLRKAWRTGKNAIAREQHLQHDKPIGWIEKFMSKQTAEIIEFCESSLPPLDSLLEEAVGEAKAFYLSVKGDILRYKSEVLEDGPERRKFSFAAQGAYDEADAIARAQLPIVHPTRLRNIVNLTVLMHEIIDCKKEAIELATGTLRQALENYDMTVDWNIVGTGFCIKSLRMNLETWGAPFK
eukprot:gene405-711_t